MNKANSVGNTLFLGLIGFAALGLYFKTLAPGIIWGDSAKLTLYAFNHSPLWDLIGGHVLHTLIAGHVAETISLDNYAQAINLVSAIFGSLTVVVVTAIVLLISGSRFAATLTGASLMLSHTFWTYSVVAESYTLVTFIACSVLLLILIAEKYKKDYLYPISGFLAATGMLANVLLVFSLPGILIIVWRRAWTSMLQVLVGFVLGAIVVMVLLLKYSGLSMLTLLAGVIGAADAYIQPQVFLKEVAATFLYITYQFPSFALVYVLMSVPTIRFSSVHAGLWVAVLGVVLFASTYQYQRHFVFLVMAYCFFSILIGLAVAESKRFPAIKKYLLLPSVILFPLLVYSITPIIAGEAELVPARPLPGRDNAYFLSPWKHNRQEPGIWARSFLKSVEKDAVIYADFTPARVLQYVQTVERVRHDVSIIEVDRWISTEEGLRTYRNSICERLAAHRTPYLAQQYEPYYKISYLSQYFQHAKFLDGLMIISAIPFGCS